MQDQLQSVQYCLLCIESVMRVGVPERESERNLPGAWVPAPHVSLFM
jgi:hypothetical protein